MEPAVGSQLLQKLMTSAGDASVKQEAGQAAEAQDPSLISSNRLGEGDMKCARLPAGLLTTMFAWRLLIEHMHAWLRTKS